MGQGGECVTYYVYTKTAKVDNGWQAWGAVEVRVGQGRGRNGWRAGRQADRENGKGNNNSEYAPT